MEGVLEKTSAAKYIWRYVLFNGISNYSRHYRLTVCYPLFLLTFLQKFFLHLWCFSFFRNKCLESKEEKLNRLSYLEQQLELFSSEIKEKIIDMTDHVERKVQI